MEYHQEYEKPVNSKTFSIKNALKFGITQFYINSTDYLLITIFCIATCIVLAASISFILLALFGITYIVLASTSLNGIMYIYIAYANPISVIASIIATFFSIYIWNLLIIKKVTNPAFYITTSTFRYLISTRAWKYVLARILYIIPAKIGLYFFVFPGIYWYIKYYFKGYSIITSDNNISIIEDHQIAANISLGAKWKLLGFVTLTYGSLGLAAQGFKVFIDPTGLGLYAIALLIAVAFTLYALFTIYAISMVYVYQKLKAQKIDLCIALDWIQGTH